jgi:hypothetical protein
MTMWPDSRWSQLPLALSVPLSWFTSPVGGGSDSKKSDMNQTLRSGRLIRPRLPGFEVTGDNFETNHK